MSEIGVPNNKFQNYNNIISAKFGEKCKTIGENAFGSSTIEMFNDDNNIITIGTNAFKSCELLEKVELPECTNIGKSAFSYCSGLTSINLPKCEIIGTNAFEFCTQISNASYDNIINIGERAFIGCKSLTEIKISKSINTIGKRAFVGCENIGTIIVDSENDFFDSRTNCNAIIETSSKTLIAGCQTTTIPESVINIGNNAFESITTLASITIPDSITSIGDNAFYRCTNLESIEIPINIISIGGDAFSGCSKLTHVKFNAENCSEMGSKEYPAFKNCTNLSSVTIGTSVVNIPPYAFYGCSKIDSIEIPKNVESIGTSAFENCKIKTIYNFSNKMTFVEKSTDYGHIAENATTIYNYSSGSKEGDYLFDEIDGKYILVKYIGNDEKLELPDSYNGNNYAIGANVFDGNTTITSVTIPNSVTSIGDYAFRRCSGLKSIEIPNSVTSIGKYAFYECNFEELNIPQSVETIGVKAFVGCRKISKVTVDQNNSHYYVDDNAIIKNDTKTLIFGCKSTKEISVENIDSFAFEGCSGLENIKILNGVKKIGGSAFYGCSGLKSIEIPESVTEIGGHAFYNCNISTVTFNAVNCKHMGNENYPAFKNVDRYGNILDTVVSSVTIGNNVTNIPAYAFYNCSQITKIAIPGDVTNIGEKAFYGCTSITSVIVGNSVTNIGYLAFYGCENNKTVYNYSNITIIKDQNNGYIGYYADNIYKCNGTNIGDYIFDVSNNKNVLIGYMGNETDLTLPNAYNDNIYEIKDGLFENSNITSITIGNKVTNIGKSAFKGCKKLESVTIPNLIILNFKINESTFEDCEKLTSFSISDDLAKSIKEINKNAFKGCKNLTSIYTNELTNIVSIGESAFDGCECLEELYLPDNLKTIGDYAFRNCFTYKKCTKNDNDYGDSVNPINENNIETMAFDNPIIISGFVMPKSVNSIGVGCFEGSGLEQLHITEDCELTTISNSAFKNCKELTSINISNSNITTINSYAFYECGNLCKGSLLSPGTSLKLPNGIQHIRDYVFYGCNLISSVTLPSSLKSLGNNSFPQCTVNISENLTETPDFTIDGIEDLKSIPFMGKPNIYIYHALKETYEKDKHWEKYKDYFIIDYGYINEYIDYAGYHTEYDDLSEKTYRYLTIKLKKSIPQDWDGSIIYYNVIDENNTIIDDKSFTLDQYDNEYTNSTDIDLDKPLMFAYSLYITKTSNNIKYNPTIEYRVSRYNPR